MLEKIMDIDFKVVMGVGFLLVLAGLQHLGIFDTAKYIDALIAGIIMYMVPSQRV